MPKNLQETHLNRARASLRQALSWYGNLRKPSQGSSYLELAAYVKPELEVLTATLNKLDHNVVRIAAFGLVSRGKSAVLNALLGQKILQTGPINGVTQYPRSVRWIPSDKVQVELIDTPGLDEIEGEIRAEMAREIAQQADLILFIVSGDITQIEYRDLQQLRKEQKPLILVFNKIDLYPDTDKEAIYRNLQRLARGTNSVTPDEVVMVAAEPAPIEVRHEWADGKVTYEWETPPPQIDELRQIILKILNREGRSLLALNALVQARNAQETIAQKTIELRQQKAEYLIWQFTKYKALAVGLNPIPFLDIIGGTLADLALIRSLARLYDLPMTGYEASKLLKTILFSSGGLLLGEITHSFFLGLGKSSAVLTSGENPTNITVYAGGAIAQAGIAGYGAYTVGKVAQVYLEKGCTWGQLGVNTVIIEILSQVDQNTILYRLQQNFESKNA